MREQPRSAASGLLPWTAVTVSVAAMVVAGTVWAPQVDYALVASVPGPSGLGEYATSDACMSCHPDQYDSWNKSYHRTMTQVAGRESVLGDFDDVLLEDRGFRYRLERRGNEFWVDTPDPYWFEARYELLRHGTPPPQNLPEQPPRILARVVMTTGSHHIQNYWIRRPASDGGYGGPDDGALVQFPWVWLIAEQRWVPNQDSFLSPPTDFVGGPSRWNAECSQCHSVATEPRASSSYDGFDTRAAELGIACEGCHGPAEDHVRHYRSPWRRYVRYFQRWRGDEPRDSFVVNPAELERDLSVEACAYCHSYGEWTDGESLATSGVPFRPGGRLELHRSVFRYDHEGRDPILNAVLEADSMALEGAFWPDGTVRVVGREYNGLLESACFTSGGITCVSCHSMHQYEDQADQLRAGTPTDATCAGCHQGYAQDPSAHTRHAPESSGSSCVNCHMPHTSYGLFSAVRSHRIDIPNIAVSVEAGRPNACNLCHLDQTLEWAGGHLTRWYGQPLVALREDERAIAAAILWVMKGDAVQRTLLGWHMGWAPAQEASGLTWMAPYLAQLLVDPYSATRLVAYRAIVGLPGLDGFRFDYVGSESERERSSIEALQFWMRAGGATQTGSRLLIGPDGSVDVSVWRRLLAERDLRRLAIIE